MKLVAMAAAALCTNRFSRCKVTHTRTLPQAVAASQVKLEASEAEREAGQM